jgi:putative membrane protein
VLIVADVLIALVALIHVYFVVLEMVLWRGPRGQATFGMTAEFAEGTATLAANQGLYNGFLVAGLVVALVAGGPATTLGHAFAVFTLACVTVAGLYGGVTVNRRILLVQAVPAILALVATLLV